MWCEAIVWGNQLIVASEHKRDANTPCLQSKYPCVECLQCSVAIEEGVEHIEFEATARDLLVSRVFFCFVRKTMEVEHKQNRRNQSVTLI